jgi:hypothetical protein
LQNFYVKITGALLLLFPKPPIFKPLNKTANFEKRISDDISKNFKSKTLTVDSVKELGGFTNRKIIKKYNNFGGLTSCV